MKWRPSPKDTFPVTISQYIQDIHTKIEAQIEASKPKVMPLKPIQSHVKPIQLQTIPQKTCPRCGYQLLTLSLDSPRTNEWTRMNQSKLAPTVPRCINDYFQFNANALMSANRLDISLPSSINPFDSTLFQWTLFDSDRDKRRNNVLCRRSNIRLFVDNNKSTSWVTILHSQRQLVPLEYSSWNISFSHYSPPIFSLHRSSSTPHSKIINPYGRTGLRGRSVFPQFGPNHYFVAFIFHQHQDEFYVLLEKNPQNEKWILPKMKQLPANLLYQSLIIAYVDHPLNTDQSWLEMELVVIEDHTGDYFPHSHWFSFLSLLTFENIETFDKNLIKSYLFK